MREFMDITKALADETRVRALMALEGGELCVCQLIELLELAPSTVSKHMTILRQARLVESRKEGRWIYYRWPRDGDSKHVAPTLGWLCGSLRNDTRIRADRKRLKAILKVEPEEICRRQTGRAGCGIKEGAS